MCFARTCFNKQQSVVSMPTLKVGIHCHTEQDYVTGAELFEDVVEEVTGLTEVDVLPKCLPPQGLELDTVDGEGIGREAPPKSVKPSRTAKTLPTYQRCDFSKMGLPWVRAELTSIRNVSQYPLVPGMTLEQRLEFERWVVMAFNNAKPPRRKGKAGTKITGKYYSLTPGHANFIGSKTKKAKTLTALTELGLMPTHFTDMLRLAEDVAPSYMTDWPHGRGIYIGADHKHSIVIGCQDHVAITYYHSGNNIHESYTKCHQLGDSLGDVLADNMITFGASASKPPSPTPKQEERQEKMLSKTLSMMKPSKWKKAVSQIKGLDIKTKGKARSAKKPHPHSAKSLAHSARSRGDAASASNAQPTHYNTVAYPSAQERKASSAKADNGGDSQTAGEADVTGAGAAVADKGPSNDDSSDEPLVSPWMRSEKFGFIATSPLNCSQGIRVSMSTSIKMLAMMSQEDIDECCVPLGLSVVATINSQETTDDKIYVVTITPIPHYAREPSRIVDMIRHGIKDIKKQMANRLKPKKNRAGRIIPGGVRRTSSKSEDPPTPKKKSPAKTTAEKDPAIKDEPMPMKKVSQGSRTTKPPSRSSTTKPPSRNSNTRGSKKELGDGPQRKASMSPPPVRKQSIQSTSSSGTRCSSATTRVGSATSMGSILEVQEQHSPTKAAENTSKKSLKGKKQGQARGTSLNKKKALPPISPGKGSRKGDASGNEEREHAAATTIQRSYRAHLSRKLPKAPKVLSPPQKAKGKKSKRKKSKMKVVNGKLVTMS